MNKLKIIGSSIALILLTLITLSLYAPANSVGGIGKQRVVVEGDIGFEPSFLSAFGELVVVEPTPQVQVAFNYNVNSRQASSTTDGSGTVTHSDNQAVLTTTTNANSTSTLESKNVIKYNAGQGAVARFTAVFTDCATGTTQEIGVGDTDDGFFFGCRGTDFGILRRSLSIYPCGNIKGWPKISLCLATKSQNG